MPLEAFSSSASIFDALSGGVGTLDRALLNGQRNIQTDVLQSIEAGFASRIDAAIAQLNKSSNSPKIDALRREQSLLLSRKTRLNTAIELLNKTLTQTTSLKSAIEHLEEQVKGVIDGTITPSNAATDWDNKLRKINILVEDATVTYKDQGVSYEKNLIKTTGKIQTDLDGSRINFTPQSFLAPYNSKDTLFINGVYLGTDYFLEEGVDPGLFNGAGNVSDGTFWNSNTAFLSTEDATGTLTEFASTAAGIPGSPTGQSGSVQLTSTATLTSQQEREAAIVAGEEAFFLLYATATVAVPSTAFGLNDVIIWIDNFDNDPNTGSSFILRSVNVAKVIKGGLGLLDAWAYNNFETLNVFGTAVNPGTATNPGSNLRALGDLGEAMSKIVFAEKHFRDSSFRLQSQANFFDPIINGIDREISDLTETALNEQQAIVTSLELQSQVTQFGSSLLEARGNALIFSLVLAQDNFNKSSGAFKATGEALFGSTLNIQV